MTRHAMVFSTPSTPTSLCGEVMCIRMSERSRMQEKLFTPVLAQYRYSTPTMSRGEGRHEQRRLERLDSAPGKLSLSGTSTPTMPTPQPLGFGSRRSLEAVNHRTQMLRRGSPPSCRRIAAGADADWHHPCRVMLSTPTGAAKAVRLQSCQQSLAQQVQEPLAAPQPHQLRLPPMHAPSQGLHEQQQQYPPFGRWPLRMPQAPEEQPSSLKQQETEGSQQQEQLPLETWESEDGLAEKLHEPHMDATEPSLRSERGVAYPFGEKESSEQAGPEPQEVEQKEELGQQEQEPEHFQEHQQPQQPQQPQQSQPQQEHEQAGGQEQEQEPQKQQKMRPQLPIDNRSGDRTDRQERHESARVRTALAELADARRMLSIAKGALSDMEANSNAQITAHQVAEKIDIWKSMSALFRHAFTLEAELRSCRLEAGGQTPKMAATVSLASTGGAWRPGLDKGIAEPRPAVASPRDASLSADAEDFDP
eukprot:CAMPEP_0170259812 /NCGR_PEP_ID=MMETSP0116_2-20130129/29778_1 /TAXON_ID=400756 /ORGANISM="Durinskia baltica, Strain CSIRO CS-38" /LENGTH=476 /DNA_ID=CAMNT_0010510859 /DNA_START=80 /DNA_END=1508 /DNA_ORIENTATION=+